MSKSLTAINIILVITDLILSALCVIGFAYGAVYFHKWWLVLFTLIPVLAYSHHSIIIDSDIRQNKVDAITPKGGEDDTD